MPLFVAGTAAAALYLTSGAMQWRIASGTTPLGLAAGVAALALHAFVTSSLLIAPEGLHLHLVAMACLVTFLMCAVVLIASLRLPVANLMVIVGPIAAATVLVCAALPGSGAPTPMSRPLTLHVVVSLIAYSILMLAAVQALATAALETALRHRRPLPLTHRLPPLETMENLLFAMIWIGITMLTLAIATGFVFLEDMFAQHVAHHTVLSCLSWLAYATLLVGRHFLGWRGLRAVRWTLIAFTLLLLAYFGSKFVLEVILES